MPEEKKDQDEKSYLDYAPGEMLPELQKKIVVLITKSPSYIVFLDEEYTIQWCYDATDEFGSIGTVLNRVAELETKSDFLSETKHLESVRSMIAEGLVRALDEEPLEHTEQIFTLAENTIAQRNREYSRKWFFLTALASLGALITILAIISAYGAKVNSVFGANATIFIKAGILGGIGAFVSIALRAGQVFVDASSGFMVHVIECVMRVCLGMSAGVLAYLLVSSGTFLGWLNSTDESVNSVYVGCLLAGASERFLTTIISKFDNQNSKADE